MIFFRLTLPLFTSFVLKFIFEIGLSTFFFFFSLTVQSLYVPMESRVFESLSNFSISCSAVLFSAMDYISSPFCCPPPVCCDRLAKFSMNSYLLLGTSSNSRAMSIIHFSRQLGKVEIISNF